MSHPNEVSATELYALYKALLDRPDSKERSQKLKAIMAQIKRVDREIKGNE